jgi:hypothetical protein
MEERRIEGEDRVGSKGRGTALLMKGIPQTYLSAHFSKDEGRFILREPSDALIHLGPSLYGNLKVLPNPRPPNIRIVVLFEMGVSGVGKL